MSSNTALDLSGASVSPVQVGSLADAAGSPTGHQVYIGGNTVQTGLDNTNTYFSGTISNGGSAGGSGGVLVKVGTGTFTMAGANSYSGGTQINAGVLGITSDVRWVTHRRSDLHRQQHLAGGRRQRHGRHTSQRCHQQRRDGYFRHADQQHDHRRSDQRQAP